jgi:hypothetical protein
MEVIAPMDANRSRWNDDRLDEFAANVDKRFDRVDHELARINDRLDDLVKAMIAATVALTGGMLAGFAGIIVLIATPL